MARPVPPALSTRAAESGGPLSSVSFTALARGNADGRPSGRPRL